MNAKLKAIIVLVSVILFGAMGVFGMKFIWQAQSSASGIEQHIPQNKSPININNLSLSSPTPSSRSVAENDSLSINQIINNTSNGNDADITGGEFAYRSGQPIIEILLKNQAEFPIQAAHVNVSLQLNDDKKPFVKEIAIPITLANILAQGDAIRVQVPVSQAEWSAEEVAQAQKRTVLAQVVSVTTADEENMDYPQTSSAVALKQTENDWTFPKDNSPQNDDKIIENKTILSEPETNETDTEPQTDVVQDILDEQKLPEKNEVGIISHQEKTLKK